MEKVSNIVVHAALKERLDALASATHRTEQELVDEAISAYLDVSDRHVAQLRNALREIEAGVPGIPHAEIESWVRSWDTEGELPQPRSPG